MVSEKGLMRAPPKVNIPVFLISNSTLPLKRQGAHGVWFYIRKSRNQEGTALSWNRAADCNIESKFDITMRGRVRLDGPERDAPPP